MTTFHGYLFSKLQNIGTKSEGPDYYLQLFDYHEVMVIKQAHAWQVDPTLHPWLNHKVAIEGVLEMDGLRYEHIMPYESQTDAHQLALELKVEPDFVWVDMLPPGPPARQQIQLTLLVQWPYRSIWEGECPTTQLYDFTVEFEGKLLWRWSDKQVFDAVTTPVKIPGGAPVAYPVIWECDPAELSAEGCYLARATYIASGQTVCREFEVKFAYLELMAP